MEFLWVVCCMILCQCVFFVFDECFMQHVQSWCFVCSWVYWPMIVLYDFGFCVFGLIYQNAQKLEHASSRYRWYFDVLSDLMGIPQGSRPVSLSQCSGFSREFSNRFIIYSVCELRLCVLRFQKC